MIRCLLLVIMVVFSVSSCIKAKDEKPELPPETSTGANTFGCEINGEVYVPTGYKRFEPLAVQYFMGFGDNSGPQLYISTTRGKGDNAELMNIVGDSIELTTGKTYRLNGGKGEMRIRYGILKGNFGEEFVPLLPSDGQLTITKADMSTRVLSGTFWFQAKSNQTSAEVKVEKGRFDVVF